MLSRLVGDRAIRDEVILNQHVDFATTQRDLKARRKDALGHYRIRYFVRGLDQQVDIAAPLPIVGPASEQAYLAARTEQADDFLSDDLPGRVFEAHGSVSSELRICTCHCGKNRVGEPQRSFRGTSCTPLLTAAPLPML